MRRSGLRPRATQPCASPASSQFFPLDASISSWSSSQDTTISSVTSTSSVISVKRKRGRPRKKQRNKPSVTESPDTQQNAPVTASRTSFISEKNKLLSIDLEAMKIDPELLSTTNEPLELRTMVFSVNLDPNSGTKAMISYTHQHKKEKALDMPLLISCTVPSPQSSESCNSWELGYLSPEYPSSLSSFKSDWHSSNSMSTAASVKEKGVIAMGKCKTCMQQKRSRRYHLAQHGAVAESIIKDAKTLELISRGITPRFRIVPKDTSLWVGNYRKANLKIRVRDIVEATYPNAEWSVVVNSGVLQAEVLPEAPDKAALSSAGSKIQVLSNLLIKPSPPNENTEDDWMEKENILPSLDITNEIEHIEFESSVTPMEPEVLPEAPDKAALSSAGSKVQVLSNLLIKPSPPMDNTEDDWMEKENIPPSLEITNEIEHIEFESSVTPMVPAREVNNNILETLPCKAKPRKGRKRRRRAPKFVDIYSVNEEEYEMLIERLGPDYKPVLHTMPTQKRAKKPMSKMISTPTKSSISGYILRSSPTTRSGRLPNAPSSLSIQMDEIFESVLKQVDEQIPCLKTVEENLLEQHSEVKPNAIVLVQKLSPAEIDHYTSGFNLTIPQLDGDPGDEDTDDENDDDSDDSTQFRDGFFKSSSQLFCDPKPSPSDRTQPKVFKIKHKMAATKVSKTSLGVRVKTICKNVCTDCKVVLKRLPDTILKNCLPRGYRAPRALRQPSKLSLNASTTSLPSYKTFTHCLERYSTPLDAVAPVPFKEADPMWDCRVQVSKMSEQVLRRYLRKAEHPPTRDYAVRGGNDRYNMRKIRRIPQFDGADDSSSDDDDECILTRSKGTRGARRSTRGRKAVIAKADDLRYPTLDITVTQSPHRLRRSLSQMQSSPKRSPRARAMARTQRHLDKVSSVTMKHTTAISGNVNPEVEVASRKLNFDLGSTIIEDKVECRFRPEVGAAQSENVMSLTQLKQQILTKTMTASPTSVKLPIINELPQMQLLPAGSSIQISDKFSVKEGVQESQVTKSLESNVIIVKSTLKDTPGVLEENEEDVHSNHSDELFSPPHEPEVREVTLTSSLEALITPYQENQPKDDTMTYNSQSNIFENTRGTAVTIDKNEELSSFESPLFVKSPLRREANMQPNILVQLDLDQPAVNLLTKADEYDIANKMLVMPGPSNCPSSFESAIMFASSGECKASPEEDLMDHTLIEDTTAMNSISVLDLTSCLEIKDVGKMETLSLNSQLGSGGLYSYITPKYKPPSRALISETMATYNIPEHRYQDPFYSDARHVTGAVDVGHSTLRILHRHHCEEFRSSFATLADYQKELAGVTSQKELRRLKLSYCTSKSVFVQPVRKPPSIKEVKLWLLKKKHGPKVKKKDIIIEEETCKEVQDHDTSEMLGLTILEGMEGAVEVTSPRLNKSSWDNSHAISGVSLNNTHGFKMTLENLQEARSLDIYQYITSLVMELHAESRGDKLPDPQADPVKVIFFALANDIPDKSPPTSLNANITTPSEEPPEHFLKGFICVSSPGPDGSDILTGTGIQRTKYIYTVPDEMSLYQKFLELYHLWNPDILMGYEIEQASWGYFVERGYVLGLNVPALLSRIKAENDKQKQPSNTPDDHQEELHSHLKITGRIVLDLWRILKHEIALQSYTFENLAYHVLHERVPHFSSRELSLWWNHKNSKYRQRTVEYFLYRVEGAFKLIDHYDLIGRTSELARLFGITFYEVLSRGSQFRVESMMLRLAKPYQYVPVSPSVQQRAHMKAPEYLPLILEPESKFYKDPVIVLDFQSLYPSIIIAYNYCFSTCLGRVEHLGTDAAFEFGAYELEVARKLIAKYLKANLLTISPCGVAFVKDAVRPGVLPRMLREILDTRLMVKKSMKKHRGNKTLQKVLHSRQLGLKLIANVTYGYTAANFSGRMPACEMADSVVSKGRETLQRAINLVENNTSWGARVVYGDTDSMFVFCAGKSREEAFRIGEEIAEAVTQANPSPVRLKLEKVYQPCILQTKKRYVGYMYESKEQKVPEFEAKGIETVRRDGCPAASKMLEKCLKLLFDNRDVSQVRNYVLKQFNKILTGRVSIQDLTFAKEYRGREGYRPGACVPALELSRKWMLSDKRREPRSGERVPYVITNGPPGLPLIKLVKSPHDLLEDNSLRPNALYYITKAIIPPINRCFKLIGADLFNWFNEMPRKQVQYLHVGSPGKGPKSTISQYFATAACASCGVQTKEGLCPKCLSNPQITIATLHQKIYVWERNYYTCKKICESCCARSTDLACNSLDCPVLYRTKQTIHDLQQTDFVRSLLYLFPEANKELF